MEIGKDLVRRSQIVEWSDEHPPLVPGVKFWRTHLEITRELSVEEWAALCEWLEAGRSAHKWWVGDCLVYGQMREDRWGHKYEQALTVFDGYTYDELATFARVSQSVPPERRKADKSWSHHQKVAGLPPEKQEELLSGDWTSHDLQKMAKEYKDSQKKKVISEAKGGKSKGNFLSDKKNSDDQKSLTDDPEPEEKPESQPKSGRVAFDAKPLRKAWTQFVQAIYATRKQFPHLAGPCDAVLASGDELTRDLENLIREGEK